MTGTTSRSVWKRPCGLSRLSAMAVKEAVMAADQSMEAVVPTVSTANSVLMGQL